LKSLILSLKKSCFNFVLLDCHVLILHQMEEQNRADEGGGTGGLALSMWESDWCDVLVVVMNLLRCVRCRDGGRRQGW